MINNPKEILEILNKLDKITFEQLDKADAMDRLVMPFHHKIMTKQLPYSIGGGIGQSRLCMFMLQKAHIGEVQVSSWDKDEVEKLKKHSIYLL